MPTWPAISFIGVNYEESGSQKNVIRSPMEHGPAKRRRRFTGAPRLISGTTDIMSAANVATFETWFATDIKDGALSFTATNPRSGVTETYAFVDGGASYRLIYVKDDRWRIAVSLEQLP